MSFYVCSSLLAFIATLQVVHSYVVPCEYEAKHCTCPKGKTVCEFTLILEDITPMTSSPKDSEGNSAGTRSPYVIQRGKGLVSSFMGTDRPCDMAGVLTDEAFISNNCTVPQTRDGVTTEPFIAINGISPGPILVVDYDATVYVHMENHLQEETSMHWHGMFQRHTAWSDGVGGMTQQSVPSGVNFDHIFQAVPEGTHWYHSHVGDQRPRGMYGALVVRPKKPPYSRHGIVDKPQFFTLVIEDMPEVGTNTLLEQSRLLGFEPDLAPKRVRTPHGEMVEIIRRKKHDGTDAGPLPFGSGMINGKGRKTPTTVSPLTEISVTRGKYYRFRLVGATSETPYQFSIDDHTLTVMATDGNDISYVDVDYIILTPGERYDFLLHANRPPLNYWIRAESLEEDVPEHSAVAVLAYKGAQRLVWTNGYKNVQDRRHVCTPDDPCTVLNCESEFYDDSENYTCISLRELTPRHPKDPEDMPRFPPSEDCIDCMHFLNFAVVGGNPSVNASSFNQVPLEAYQTHCYKYDIDNDPSNNNVTTCTKDPDAESCINVIPVANQANYRKDRKKGEYESVIMVFSALNSRGSHPVHMHGHAFHVVHIGYDGTDLECEETTCYNPGWANDIVPDGVLERVTKKGRITNAAIEKDTVIVPAGGYVVVAIFADNPGYWYLHCHLEGHTEGGMIITMQEYSPDQQWFRPPGINGEGGFYWNVNDYYAHVAAEKTCKDAKKKHTGKNGKEA